MLTNAKFNKKYSKNRYSVKLYNNVKKQFSILIHPCDGKTEKTDTQRAVGNWGLGALLRGPILRIEPTTFGLPV